MILVVGAGIAGLSCALALAPYGDVVVAERRSAAAANVGAGIQLSPNAVKALAAIGARDAVAARASRPAALEVRAAGRRSPLVRLDYDAGIERRFGAPYLTAARADLYAGLAEACAGHPSITVRHDLPVDAITFTADGFRAENLGEPAAFVVAADGVNSAIREKLFGDVAEETADIAWRGTAPQDGSPHTELTLASGAHLVRYAMAGGRDNMVLIAGRRRHPDAFASGPLGPRIAGVSSWTPWPIKVRRRARFHLGGAVLAGDASHAMPPFLAQGGAMAIEDAAVLGAAVATHGPTAAAAAAYAEARRARIRRVAAQTERQGAIYHLAPPLSLARDAVMRRLGPGAILAQVGWIYGFEPPARL